VNLARAWRNRRDWLALRSTHVWAFCPRCGAWTGIPAEEESVAVNIAAREHDRVCPFRAPPEETLAFPHPHPPL
jgi:hypothetical protein